MTVELQYCDGVRCFNVEDPGEDGDNASSSVWLLYDPGATWVAPVAVSSNAVVDLPPFAFEDAGLAGAHPADVTDLRSRAANVFANLVGGDRAFRSKIVDLIRNNGFDCGGLP